MQCRYIGSDSEIGELVLTKYGEAFELPDDLAHDVIACVPFLPSSHFDAIGYTTTELQANQFSAGASTDVAFKAKWVTAHQSLAALRELVAKGGKINDEVHVDA